MAHVVRRHLNSRVYHHSLLEIPQSTSSTSSLYLELRLLLLSDWKRMVFFVGYFLHYHLSLRFTRYFACNSGFLC
jgi:hypothetical protein